MNQEKKIFKDIAWFYKLQITTVIHELHAAHGIYDFM